MSIYTETEEYRGVTIELTPDEMSESPRDWGNVCRMVCWHRRYDIGDKHDFADADECQLWAGNNHHFIFPLFAYEHGGIALSLGRSYPFDCPWDSGQLGFMLVPGTEYATKDSAFHCAETEVLVMNQYLCGDVWFYYVPEMGDSCGGIYGRDTALEYACEYIDYVKGREAMGEYLP